MEKIRIDKPIIVEGKYDKITLSSLLDANIITLGGFSVFHEKEKTAMIRRVAERNGIIVLTDSDGAGKVLRGPLPFASRKKCGTVFAGIVVGQCQYL